jgi:putative transposase
MIRVGVRHEGLQVRLDVNNVQAGYLAGCAGASRAAYNFAVELLRAHQQEWARLRDAGVAKSELPKPLTAIDVQGRWHAVKSARYPWHGEYPSKVYLFAIRQAVKAHRDWMAGKTGFPRFRSRRDEWSFRVCETLELRTGRLLLPKLGEVRIAAPDPRQAKVRRLVRRRRARVVSVKVFRDACGGWWASLTVERTATYEPPADPKPAPVVGVDVGVKTLAVAATSAAEVLLAAKGADALRRWERKLRAAQRAVSRKDREHGKETGSPHPRRSPSRRRADARRRLARVHRRVRNRRATRLHQLTRQLADTGAAVVIENLNVRGMTARGGARKRGLNRRIADAAFGELRRQLGYKLPEDRLLVAPRFFPSSKRCSHCGVENQDLTLRDRVWMCTACGARHDRDVNAAANLAAWGEAQLAGKPLTWGAQAGDRQRVGPTAETTRHARGGDYPTRPRRGRVPVQHADAAAAGTRPPADRRVQDLDASGQEAVASAPYLAKRHSTNVLGPCLRCGVFKVGAISPLRGLDADPSSPPHQRRYATCPAQPTRRAPGNVSPD